MNASWPRPARASSPAYPARRRIIPKDSPARRAHEVLPLCATPSPELGGLRHRPLRSCSSEPARGPFEDRARLGRGGMGSFRARAGPTARRDKVLSRGLRTPEVTTPSGGKTPGGESHHQNIMQCTLRRCRICYRDGIVRRVARDPLEQVWRPPAATTRRRLVSWRSEGLCAPPRGSIPTIKPDTPHRRRIGASILTDFGSRRLARGDS